MSRRSYTEIIHGVPLRRAVMASKRKAYAYITHANRLLVFRHVDAPEAGIQVPGGTMEEGELAASAVMREAFEETGLLGLQMGTFLGETFYVLPEHQGTHHRQYFHLVCIQTPPERWYYDEVDPSDGSPAPIPFELYWAPLPNGIPQLSGNLDEMLPALLSVLEL